MWIVMLVVDNVDNFHVEIELVTDISFFYIFLWMVEDRRCVGLAVDTKLRHLPPHIPIRREGGATIGWSSASQKRF